jgi:hypothetical protein
MSAGSSTSMATDLSTNMTDFKRYLAELYDIACIFHIALYRAKRTIGVYDMGEAFALIDQLSGNKLRQSISIMITSFGKCSGGVNISNIECTTFWGVLHQHDDEHIAVSNAWIWILKHEAAMYDVSRISIARELTRISSLTVDDTNWLMMVDQLLKIDLSVLNPMVKHYWIIRFCGFIRLLYLDKFRYRKLELEAIGTGTIDTGTAGTEIATLMTMYTDLAKQLPFHLAEIDGNVKLVHNLAVNVPYLPMALINIIADYVDHYDHLTIMNRLRAHHHIE